MAARPGAFQVVLCAPPDSYVQGVTMTSGSVVTSTRTQSVRLLSREVNPPPHMFFPEGRQA